MTRLNTRRDWPTLQCPKSDELYFLDIFFGNKVAILCSVDLSCHDMLCLFNCNVETIEVIAGHKHFL